MKRGDTVIIAPPSPFNKPRPALVIQARVFEESENVTVALLTSDLTRMPSVRVPIHPSAANGLRKVSEIMVDNLQTIPIDRIGGHIGSAERAIVDKVDQALRVFLGLT